MDISINIESPIPVYKQIVMAVLGGIECGELAIGSALPPIRQLAADLRLTTATVSKSYQILERSKIITTGGRRGTFISDNAISNADRYLQEELKLQVDEFISMQMRYGVSLERLQSTFSQSIIEHSERGLQ